VIFHPRLLLLICTQHLHPARQARLNARLEELAKHLPPGGPARVTGPLLVEELPINLAATRVDINFGQLLPGGTLPCPADDVERNHHEKGEVRLEETLGTGAVDSGIDGGVELHILVSML
jgi:hypothetical protein